MPSAGSTAIFQRSMPFWNWPQPNRVSPAIVFNGDFHWFDAEPAWFAAIEEAVAPHRALRGNVETEIARKIDTGAGCGCAYPPTVDDSVVRHSNQITAALRSVTPASTAARLSRLPMHLVAQVGGLRVGIVHGDAGSLSGWRFAQDALDDAGARSWLDGVSGASRIDIFASTHTCLAALRDFGLPGGRLTVVNNGAAGLPNFSRSSVGLITRIATSPSRHRPLYGMVRDGVHIDAIGVRYDQHAFLARFLDRWPQGSPAHASYYRRITRGPDYDLAGAIALDCAYGAAFRYRAGARRSRQRCRRACRARAVSPTWCRGDRGRWRQHRCHRGGGPSARRPGDRGAAWPRRADERGRRRSHRRRAAVSACRHAAAAGRRRPGVARASRVGVAMGSL